MLRHKRMPLFWEKKMPRIIHSAIRIPRKEKHRIFSEAVWHMPHSSLHSKQLLVQRKLIQFKVLQIVCLLTDSYLHFGSPLIRECFQWTWMTLDDYQDQLWCEKKLVNDRKNLWPTSVGGVFGSQTLGG